MSGLVARFGKARKMRICLLQRVQKAHGDLFGGLGQIVGQRVVYVLNRTRPSNNGFAGHRLVGWRRTRSRSASKYAASTGSPAGDVPPSSKRLRNRLRS